MELIIVRHGKTRATSAGIFEGTCSKNNLTKSGIGYANKLAGFFAGYGIDEIYSSPLKRAVQTAKPVARLTNLKIRIEPLLREISYGSWEGKRKSELAKTGEWKARERNKYGFAHPGKNPAGLKGESYEMLEKKTAPLFKKLLRKSGKRILIVGHLGTLRAARRLFEKISRKKAADFVPSYRKIYVVKASKGKKGKIAAKFLRFE